MKELSKIQFVMPEPKPVRTQPAPNETKIQKPKPVQIQASTLWVVMPWVLLLVVVSYFVFLKKPNDDDDDFTPGPDINKSRVVKTAEKCHGQYAHNLEKAFDKLADAVESKRIKTREQLKSQAQEYTELARLNAFGPIAELDQEFIPKGDFSEDSREVSTYLRYQAEGHGKAK